MKPNNSNPTGPNQDYNGFDSAVYNTYRFFSDVVPFSKELTVGLANVTGYENTILGDSVGNRAALDGMRDTPGAVQHIANFIDHLTAPRTPAQPRGNGARQHD